MIPASFVESSEVLMVAEEDQTTTRRVLQGYILEPGNDGVREASLSPLEDPPVPQWANCKLAYEPDTSGFVLAIDTNRVR